MQLHCNQWGVIRVSQQHGSITDMIKRQSPFQCCFLLKEQPVTEKDGLVYEMYLHIND